MYLWFPGLSHNCLSCPMSFFVSPSYFLLPPAHLSFLVPPHSAFRSPSVGCFCSCFFLPLSPMLLPPSSFACPSSLRPSTLFCHVLHISSFLFTPLFCLLSLTSSFLPPFSLAHSLPLLPLSSVYRTNTIAGKAKVKMFESSVYICIITPTTGP